MFSSCCTLFVYYIYQKLQLTTYPPRGRQLAAHTPNVIRVTFTRELCPPAYPTLSLTVPLQRLNSRRDLPIRNPHDARLPGLVLNCAYLLGGEDARLFPVIDSVPAGGCVSLGSSGANCR